MTKKIIYSSILAMMLLGCGSGDSSSTDNKTSNNQEQQQEEIENRVKNNQTNQINEISLKGENRNLSKKIDIKYLSENNVKKLIDILNQNGYNTFSQKHVDTIYSDFDENGKEFYIITFDEDGYIILNPNLNSNALYGLDETNIYNSISQTEKITINIDWMSIIADEVEIPFEKLKKAYQKTGDRKLITKITWTSGSTRTDFDLYVKSPDGQICNWEWNNRNKEDWGTTFLRDDQGEAYRKSYEAFSVNLDKMDEYATKNNLFGIDEGKYKFYVARYTGANINYKFSYGVTGECSASTSSDCPHGNWINKADIKHKDYYSVYYKPKKVSTSTKSKRLNVTAINQNNYNFHINGKDFTVAGCVPSTYAMMFDYYVRYKGYSPVSMSNSVRSLLKIYDDLGIASIQDAGVGVSIQDEKFVEKLVYGNITFNNCVSKIGYAVHVSRENSSGWNYTTFMSKVITNIKNNKPIAISVKVYTHTTGNTYKIAGGHHMLITGYNNSNTIYANDTWGNNFSTWTRVSNSSSYNFIDKHNKTINLDDEESINSNIIFLNGNMIIILKVHNSSFNIPTDVTWYDSIGGCYTKPIR